MTNSRNALSAILGNLSFALLFSSITVDAASLSDYQEISLPFDAESVGIQNIYYFPGQSGVPNKQNEGFTANAGFVVTSEGVVVFDALGTPSLGAAMLKAIRKVSDKPVTHVVISHYHADHIYGLQAFKEATDAKVIAQEAAHSYIESPQALERLRQRREALAPWVNEQTKVIAPDTTFKDEYFIESGDVQFSIYHAGPAHAPDDSMMMVEPAGVLFSGDIIQNGRVPFLNSAEVDSGKWMQAIEKVKKLKPVVLIPGHGSASDDAMEALSFTYDYLKFVRESMKSAVANWVAFEDAYEQTDWSRYEGLPAFEASNKANAYRVYLEMEQRALETK